ncbi:hypothetical protein I204_00261 [Kwoniella mangroviensis CBS 8886]|uniref:uncharacterized protein n=1 Tax=Kwoniella mangroviensis CBS 8507 TaxID=1296122 RepID=UPI00080CD9D6|nr:uncharacterized protein I203_02562 [Kwoniella mangroviensis CBS 8507]OCF67904.1 hypothetical protein I203_02562 [Kwoniella mangroviensis CBS 8507]OCF78323.1 hypothetical protein I204_00261 [Kwoniella mangroviensis CBS 8886]
MQKTKGDTFDLRAEEDAARRLNVGKSINVSSSISGLNSRAKRTDLIGKVALKEKVDAIAKDHGVTIDPEVSLYLLSTIENRIKSLFSSAIKAQQHRTQSSHLYFPPLTKSSHSDSKSDNTNASGSGNGGRAMWSSRITSDPSQVLDLVNKSYREEEQEFRKSRMNRLAKEAELQKIRDRASSLSLNPDDGGVGGSGPSTPISKPSPSSYSTPAAGGSGGGTPMFGAIRESTTKSGSSSSKKGKINPRDVSAEVQHKMANATAMRSVGMGKKYGWMTGNVPSISSPLAGGGSTSKKRKLDKERDKEKEKSKLSSNVTTNSPIDRDSNSNSNKQTPEPSTPNTNTNTSDIEKEKERPNKRSKPTIRQPTRRLIMVEKEETEGGDVEDKKVEDDKVLTLLDLVFAMEHNGLDGKGIGKEEEILQKVWARKGGPWGEDGWDGRR